MDAPNREDPGRFKQAAQGSTVSFEVGLLQPPAKVVKLLFVHQEDSSRTITTSRDMSELASGEDQTKFRVTIEVPGDAAPGLYRLQGVRVHTVAGEVHEVEDVSQQLGPVWLEVLEEPNEVRLSRGYWVR